NFSLDTTTSHVRLALRGDARQFCKPQLAAMAGYYAEALAAMAINRQQDCLHTDLLSEGRRRQLLRDWTDRRVAYPQANSISELFEAQAGRTPDRIAGVTPSGGLTYCQLNERANQLAHPLQGLGVGPETRVGSCMARSADLIIGLLGILKA